MNMIRLTAIALFSVFLSTAAPATESTGLKELTKTGKFADVRDDLKAAIVNRGYVVDYVGQFNKMLERTSEAVGSVTAAGAKSPYIDAEFLQFCAAKLTHDAVSANPQNIVNCPYVVYVYELNGKPDTIHVGYRQPVGGVSKLSRKAIGEIDKLLNDIITEAAK